MKRGLEQIMADACHILKQRKSRKIICLLAFLLGFSCLMMNACSANLSELFGNWNLQGDWTFDLIGGYSIWRVSSVRLVLGRYNNMGLSLHAVIEPYVTCFAYNERFIAVRKLDVPNGYRQEDIFNMDFDQAEYFIVDSQTDEVYGPYGLYEAFDAQCVALGTGDLGNWIDTYPAPEGAIY